MLRGAGARYEAYESMVKLSESYLQTFLVGIRGRFTPLLLNPFGCVIAIMKAMVKLGS